MAALGCAGAASAVEPPAGDAREGEQVLRTHACTACHSLDGEGARSASDLGNRVARDYSPSALVSIVWNHKGNSRLQVASLGVDRPLFTAKQASDLLAYAFTNRYFEEPGDAARGKVVFESKRCIECHGVRSVYADGAKPVVAWTCLTDPIALANQMWDHAPKMIAALQTRKIQWAQLTTQQLTDLLVYLQNLPETRNRPTRLSLGPANVGETLFQSKGCGECHSAKQQQHRALRMTAANFAGAMWNHRLMVGPDGPSLSREEMSALFGYLWSRRLFADDGNARRGGRVYMTKGCQSCHTGASDKAPLLKAMDPLEVTAALWNHQPAMLAAMRQQDKPWPRFRGTEMSDLLAYLSSNESGESNAKLAADTHRTN